MKKLLLIFAIFFFVSTEAQHISATLIFTDGTTVDGFAVIKVKGVLKDEEVISFRLTMEDEPEDWKSDVVAGVTFYFGERSATYRYIEIRKSSLFPQLLRILQTGDVMLYCDDYKNFSTLFDPNFQATNEHGQTVFQSYSLYLKREQEAYPVKLPAIGWKKAAKNYFSDCNELVQKIQDKEYQWETIPEMVFFYNNFCDE